MQRSLPVLILLASCARATAPEATPEPAEDRLRFAPLTAPASEEEGLATRVAPSWTLGSHSGAVRLQPVVAEGVAVAGTRFGVITDAAGSPLPRLDEEGAPRPEPWVGGSTDFAALLEVGDQLVLFNHVEQRSGGLWVTDLDLDDQGTLSATATRALDLSRIHGIKDPCAGDVTAWGTVLSGEEYEPDATRIGEDGRFVEPLCKLDKAWQDHGRSLPEGTTSWPYDYGWMLETTLRPEGAEVVKRTAMGRFSHELGVVMPDERTVYLTDDVDQGGGLFLFVADAPRDLSAGTLYALRWAEQTSSERGGSARIEWVSLGHASEDSLRATMAARSLDRDDLLLVDEVAQDGSCPLPDQRVVDTFENYLCGLTSQCVAIVPGQEALATRLETRRTAALAGGTLEFSKAEGLAWDPKRERVLVAISQIARTMSDEAGHIRLPENPCGAIFAFDALGSGRVDTAGSPIASDFVASTLGAIHTGRPTGEEGEAACHIDGIANPDNITLLGDHDWLVIAEDTRKHRHPTLWVLDLVDGGLERLATGPPCSEWTGLQWFPDVRGQSWLTVSMQHAYRYKDCFVPEDVRPPGAVETWSGAFGPWP